MLREFALRKVESVMVGVGGIGYRKRRSIVVATNENEATMEPWSRPSFGWRKHVRKAKARKQ